jgi:D-hexose-6-phosphate mutarotase
MPRMSTNSPRIEKTETGLTRVVLQTPDAEAHVYTHGAHLTHFQPRGHKPVLFMSAKSWFEPGKPIRGGVPICFPWFGPGFAASPKTPMHGLARLREWDIAHKSKNSITLGLVLEPFVARFSIEITDALAMTFSVHNTGDTPHQYEEALHTYFAVGDIKQTTVTGLENADYLDNTVGLALKNQGADPIRFVGETDRVYVNTQAACVIHDAAWQRRVTVEKTGSDATVVWNPWIAKAKAMPDFGDDEWPQMLCIETANCKQHAVTLAPGATHTTRAVIRVTAA